MKILHLFAPGPYGGVETVVRTLVLGLARKGNTVTVVLILDRDSAHPPLTEFLEACGIKVRIVQTNRRGYQEERVGVRLILQEWRPDIVHTHGYRADVLDAPVARRLGIPTVTTAHGFTKDGLRGRFYEWVQRRALSRFQAVFAVSRSIAERLRRAGVPDSKIHLVPNAWEPTAEILSREEARKELGIHSQGPAVGWIGRFTPEKAPELAVASLSLAKAPDLRLAMLGTGRLEERTRDLASRLGLENQITWHGSVSDAFRVLKAFDLVLLTSSSEGSPMVILEAMNAGVPIVATAVGGVPDLISASEGILVPTGNAEALANAMDSILAEGGKALERAERAKERFEREFSTGPWIEAHLEIYRSVVP